MLASLFPAAVDLTNLAAVWGSAVVLMLWGRALTLGQGTPELQVLAGWGGYAILMTCWGVLLPLPLWWPAGAVGAVALVALATPRLTPSGADWLALVRMMVLALPLWLIIMTAQPSQPDTFLNLLPNAAYLYDHALLPTDARPPSHSFLPGAPYNTQFWAYLAGLPLPQLPASALAHINVLLHLLFGLLLARLLQSEGEVTEIAPGWGATALGLLFAIGLNPGFVPRIYFAAYGEASVAVCLGAAGWLAARSLGAVAEGRRPLRTLWILALVAAALVNIKQEAVAFVAALALGVGALALLDRRVGWRGLALHAPAFLPAAGLYLLWRWFVLTSFANGGELELMPVGQWQWNLLPDVLQRMGEIVLNKGVFFGFLALGFVLLAWRLWRRGIDHATRLLALLLVVFIAYNAFLLFTYIAHFSPEMSADAHSFFRYNTHLSLLMVLALAAAVRAELAERGRLPILRWERIGAAGAVMLALVAPVGFAQRLRFDLEMPQPLVRALGRDAAELVRPNDELALILPGDNGSVAAMLESVLRYQAPRRPSLKLVAVNSLDRGTLPALAARGIGKALISCVPQGVDALPAGKAVLLEREGEAWRPLAIWRYPERDGGRWTSVLAAKPLCR